MSARLPGRRVLGVWLLLTCTLATACGRKGPPLPPLIRIPAAVDALEARRMGRDVYVTFTVPVQNVDGSTPGDVERVDLFAATAATPPAPGELLRPASRIATIRVGLPADGGGGDAAPGATVVVREARPDTADPVADPTRFYMAVAFSARDRPGASSTIVAVPLTMTPDPPGGLALASDETGLTLSWRAVDGAAYNVYADDPPAPDAASPPEPGVAIGVPPPAALNPSPLTTPAFSEPVSPGVERCYHVRTVQTLNRLTIESAPSLQVCETFTDRFPPAPPTDLSAVARDDGGIEVRWTPNTEPDLAGYLVLRGRPGDATLLQIAATPAEQSRIIDRDVTPDTRYVYAVVAVDTATPPNRSAESARDEVDAR